MPDLAAGPVSSSSPSELLVKFSLKQLTQQGSSEGLCVVSVLAATFTRMSPRRARGGFPVPKQPQHAVEIRVHYSIASLSIFSKRVTEKAWSKV